MNNVYSVDAKFAALFDIDGTLADVSHRRHFVESRPKNWKAFYSRMSDDTTNRQIALIAHALKRAGYRIVLVTGRPDEYETTTRIWLKRRFIIYDDLFMRKAGDNRPDEIIKAELLNKIQEAGYVIDMVFDDRKKVVDMWRSKGLLCLQVAEGDF